MSYTTVLFLAAMRVYGSNEERTLLRSCVDAINRVPTKIYWQVR